jgi:hypothetical protein
MVLPPPPLSREKKERKEERKGRESRGKSTEMQKEKAKEG